MATDDRPSDPTAPTGAPAGPPAQGNLGNLDSSTGHDAGELSSQMSGGAGLQAQAPIVWGSIRVFSVYGSWSFWRKPKRT
jgi:hypothetical protein